MTFKIEIKTNCVTNHFLLKFTFTWFIIKHKLIGRIVISHTGLEKEEQDKEKKHNDLLVCYILIDMLLDESR